MIYLPTPAGAVEQGDIFDGCPLVGLPDGCRSVPPAGEWTIPLGRAVVLTQTCDIAQGKTDRAVVAVVHEAAALVARGLLKAAALRDNIRPGRVFGLYYLPVGSPAVPVPESVIDLRDLYTIPLTQLDQLVIAGRRVCRLATPYREHLAQHFAVTYMRIALPEPYETRP